MKSALRVLLVEDSEDDAALLLRELRRSFDVTHLQVETPEAMIAALDAEPWDVVVSDYSMPRFTAPAAFAVLQSKGLDLPFIIVSGTVGEETAVEAMRLGVHDYLVKGKLTRLVPAIQRELRESENRRRRRGAEAELGQSEARYRVIFESSPLPMWVMDRETLRFLDVNEAAVHHYGHSREELDSLTIRDVQLDEDGRGVHEEGGITPGEGVVRHRKKDGSVILVEMKTHDFQFEDRPARLVLVNDVTVRLRAEDTLRKTEEQLRHAQKMEAVGRLAGGVAHDFNNILSVILSYCDLILADPKDTDSVRADLLEVRAAGMRAAELTKQLLLFSRHQGVEAKVFDLNRVVGGMEKLLQRLLGADVELTIRSSRGGSKVLADPGQVEQVVMNLAVNARDAMPLGGKLTVEVSNVQLDEDYAQAHHGVRAGSYVMLAVTDTGEGMDRATLARIFEPFFTTKELGKGTGLGLSTVFGIVQQAGGHVWVYSEPGTGTTFKVYLPRTAAAETRTTRPPPLTSRRGTETILLVEDDEQLRTLTGGILTRLGYRVLTAPAGAEALRLCEQHSGKIHVLLTDVVMPGMSGRQLAEKILALRPDTRPLFMSGYTDEAIVHHGVLEPGVSFLQKPITPDSLGRKIREVLRARHTPATGMPRAE
jgi:two-component system, cell cycle sensor histidine kinase and response regulator CckA